jgi:hypothetical protein
MPDFKVWVQFETLNDATECLRKRFSLISKGQKVDFFDFWPLCTIYAKKIKKKDKNHHFCAKYYARDPLRCEVMNRMRVFSALVMGI